MWWIATAAAGTLTDGVWVEEVAPPADPDELDRLLEEAAGRAPPEATGVRLTHGGLPVRMPAPLPILELKDEGRRALPIAHPGAASGLLSNRAVYVSQCHGWIWYDSLGQFSTQRGLVWDTVEDFHNPEGANQILAQYLENAGAAVFTVKERDHHAEWAIVDDGDPGYEEVGAGFAAGLDGFALLDEYPYGVDPFDAGGTRTLPSDGGGIARWTPEIPYDDHWAVYVTWDANAAHATDAHYRIVHPGGAIDRWFDQTTHGSTW